MDYDEYCKEQALEGQAFARELEEAVLRTDKVDDCKSCLEYGPYHYASPNCKSGGHPHCSCDICF